jgi:hypothetical protein
MVRDATAEDWSGIWSFVSEIVAAGDTFPYDVEMDESEARAMWIQEAPRTFAIPSVAFRWAIGRRGNPRSRAGV